MRKDKIYSSVSISLQREIFRRAGELAKDIYRENKKDERKIIEALSVVSADKKVNDDGTLDLSYYDQIVAEISLNKAISEIMKTQSKREQKQIYDILNYTANEKYGALQYVTSLGSEVDFRKLSSPQREKIINTSIKGTQWSERIWKNKRALEVNLRNDVSNLLNGRITSNEIITKTKRNFEVSRNQSKRLVNTEVARVQDEVNYEYAIEEGIYEQMFLATLDSATSEICQDLDGERFHILDPDLPSIPLHPNCRSVLVNVPNSNWNPKVRHNNELKEIQKWSTYEKWTKTQES